MLRPRLARPVLFRLNSSLPKIDANSPHALASKSHLQQEAPKTTAPVNPRKKRPLLSDSKYESAAYQLPKWKEAMGEVLIRAIGLDMDRIRAGPIAGSHYYALCKTPGLQFEGEELTKTARFFYEDLKLPRTFSQWFQICILHEWMLFVRMRAMPFKYGRNYQQKLVDRTFQDIELRLFDEMGVNSQRIADQYLKDFNSQLRGAVFAYDEGFATDDATLATALWRNLFGGKKDVDLVALEAVVRYVRGQLYVLSKMSDREFAMGKFQFVSPDEVVYRLTAEEEQVMKKRVAEEYRALDEDEKTLPSQRSKMSYEN